VPRHLVGSPPRILDGSKSKSSAVKKQPIFPSISLTIPAGMPLRASAALITTG
jgi:hypothetical protein